MNIGNNPLRNESANELAATLKNLKKLEYLDLGIDDVFDCIYKF